MRATVTPGELSAYPTGDATGMERRAHGEFVGPGGELASYALGWRTDTDPQEGRLTVGIGAGNPGGGTFHMRVFENEGSYAFQLIDEPFESVPEGGPHLMAEEARAKPDLEFVFWVGDNVLAKDPHAMWMEHWLLGTRSITTPEVFERKEPVLLVVNDHDDDLWQLIGPTDPGEKGLIGHLFHAVDEDPSLAAVLDLQPGEEAVRERVGGPWTRRSYLEEAASVE
jgi:hypothetical protein